MYGDLYGLGGFNALDALADAGKALLPVGVGAATCFGTAEAIDFLVKNEEVKKYKWLIGFGTSLVVGLGMWKFRNDVEGGVTIGSGGLTALVGFGLEKLNEYKLTLAAAPAAGLGRYTLRPATAVPAGVFGAYKMNKAQPLFAGNPQVVDFRRAAGRSPALMV